MPPTPTRPTLSARRRTRSGLALVVAALGLGAGAASAGDAYAPRLVEKSASVVIVKSVLKMSFGGGNDSERNDERVGTLIDANGLVLIQGWTFSPSIKVNPTNIRVLFDGEEKEYESVLGATDSKLGLAFVKVKDLAGRKVTPVDLTATSEPVIGDELFGVVRTDSGFDYAPYYGTARIVGQVKKPREMWMPNGFAPIGVPLYAADGKVTGVVIRQTGISEEGGGARIFLLPMKAFTPVVVQATKAAQKALEDAKKAETEAAEEAAKGGAKPADGAGDAPKDAPKPPADEGMDGAGMGEPK
jgi:hypothetical protein